MTGNQMMLSIAGMIFLSMLILNVHSSTTDKLIIIYSNEAVIEATAIAQALFEEIQTKAFDAKTVTMAAKERNLLTPLDGMGPGFGEVLFNDIDDYNGYEITDTSNVMGEFDLSVEVYYVDETSPYNASSTRTYIKRVDISISNESLPTTLTFKKLISY